MVTRLNMFFTNIIQAAEVILFVCFSWLGFLVVNDSGSIVLDYNRGTSLSRMSTGKVCQEFTSLRKLISKM